MTLDDDDRRRVENALRMLRKIEAIDPRTMRATTIDGDPYAAAFGEAQGTAIAALHELVPVLRYELDKPACRWCSGTGKEPPSRNGRNFVCGFCHGTGKPAARAGECAVACALPAGHAGPHACTTCRGKGRSVDAIGNQVFGCPTCGLTREDVGERGVATIDGVQYPEEVPGLVDVIGGGR